MFHGIREGQRASERVFDFGHKMLVEDYKAKDVKGKMPYKLMHLIREDGEEEDDGERIRYVFGYAIAGFDTTANTLSFALRVRELAMEPEEQEKLRTALRKASDQNQPVTAQSLGDASNVSRSYDWFC